MAAAAARAQDAPVEVASSRSASVREWANPDGSFTADMYSGPNWVQDDAGAWHEVDTTLMSDGSGAFTTEASPLQVTVGEATATKTNTGAPQQGSAADPATVVSVGDLNEVSADAKESDQVIVGWAGDLPAPTVDGSVATFAQVAAGMDVRVKANPTGVETFIDLTQRPAEVPASGYVVDLPLESKGLRAVEDDAGGVSLLNSAGDPVASTPQARVWDGSTDPKSGLPAQEISADTQLAKAASGWVMRVVVPAEFFDRKGLVYPVTVDPAVSVQTLGDTFVEKGYNDTNFAGEDDLRVGTYDAGTHVARSYLKFSLDPEAPGFYSDETTVTDAKLHLYSYWSSSCTATRIDSHQATATWSAPALTWNTRTAYSATNDGSVTEAKGFSSSCAAGWLNGSTGIDVTDTLQSWAGPGANQGIVLDAADETDSRSWKRFYSGEYSTVAKRPYLTVTYQPPPDGDGGGPEEGDDPIEALSVPPAGTELGQWVAASDGSTIAEDPGAITALGVIDDSWWDGQCGSDTSTADKFVVIKQYPRPIIDSRMSGSLARMYCGKRDSTQSESAFGLRHIRAGHKADFASYAALDSSQPNRNWGNFMHFTIWKTVQQPRRATVQNANRYCLQATFQLKRLDNRQTAQEMDVAVILGRTGTRIMSAFPGVSKEYCKGVLINGL